MQVTIPVRLWNRYAISLILFIFISVGSGCDPTDDANRESVSSDGSKFDISTLELKHDMRSEDVQKVKDLAEQGDSTAAFTLGLMHEHGLGVEKSDKSMIYWISSAADDGLAAAYTMLGIYRLIGKGVEKNVGIAVENFTIAGRSGDPVALYELGQVYLTNDFGRLQRDRAFFLIRESALRGYPKAQFKLGLMWENGEGTRRNLSRARNWLKHAAKSGLKSADVELKRIDSEYKTFEWDDNVYFVETSIDCGLMRVSGEFSGGITDVVRSKFDEKIELIVLESPGGLLEEGIALGEFIRENELNVYSGHICESACVLAFLGGKERYVSPNVEMAFHSPRFAFTNESSNETESLEIYLSEFDDGMDKNYIKKVFEGDETVLPTITDLLDYGIASEVLTAKGQELDCISACVQEWAHSYNDFRYYWCAARCGNRCEDSGHPQS